MDEEYKLDEKEYFEQRNKDFKIEFKKLPPKTAPAMMDVSYLVLRYRLRYQDLLFCRVRNGTIL